LSDFTLVVGTPDFQAATMSSRHAADHASERPITLHQVMQEVIAEGLEKHYKVQETYPHSLFVLLMQINDKKVTRRRPRPRIAA
jgi:hypothetical protein